MILALVILFLLSGAVTALGLILIHTRDLI